MDEATISKQLDTIISLLKLANQDALVTVRTQLDDVAKAVVDATSEPVTVGKLKKEIATKTNQSEKTVQRRIADLVAMGLLTKEGGGNTATYQSTGLL
jgi:predicted HTH transcriptional regulator